MSRRGFTLLEVLVALMVFAVAAIALAGAYVNVLNAYEVVGRGNAHEEDVRFARAQLLVEPDRVKAEEGADFEGASGGRVRWQSTIEPMNTADLFRVTFRCEISELTGIASNPPVEQTFYLLRPTWSEGTEQAKFRGEARERILDLRKKLP